VSLAHLLNYDTIAIEALCAGALLHDLGKLLIPKNIIQKSDKLNQDEMELMKQHCTLGFNLIKDLGLAKETTDIILQYHERLDGSGYPYGLVKNRISENSQIVMVADVLDAITSYRPYKASQQMCDVLIEFKKNASRYPEKLILLLDTL